MADDFKAKGNAAFSAGNYQEAVEHFTAGTKADPNNHVLYSNRSAALASLGKYKEALEDAQKVVELKADWPKGYSRMGAAYFGLKQLDDAISAYKKGLELDPNNAQMREALQEAEQAKSRPPMGGGLFGPEFMGRLAMNPTTRALLSQPALMAKLQDVAKNPQNMSMYLNDPAFQQCLSVGLGISFASADEAAGQANGTEEESKLQPMETETKPSKPEPAPEPEPEPEPEVDEEAKAEAARQKEAQSEKEQGNAAYKAKKFDEAIEHYNKALELYDKDISFLTNRAAVHLEKGDYDKAIEDCDKAVERGRELRADYKVVARALTRKGNALVKKGELENAIDVYHKALTEHRNADTLKRLNETEKALKEKKEREYINLDISNEEKEKGNQAFKEQKYPEAVKHYTEALARGPPSVNPEAHKLYSNRAACYTKLGAWNEGVKDADECIRLAPTFAKGYSRKGHLQFFMKEYEKALETYEKGLEHDPGNEELIDGKRRAQEALWKLSHGMASEEEMKARQAKAMQDPEIQTILTDPVMRQVLKDFEENPKAAQHHLKNPDIINRLQKLQNAGIVRFG